LRGEDCAYEDKKWRTKDHLRSEIERLRAEERRCHGVLRALAGNDPKRWDKVLGRMRAGEPPETIAEWILVHSSKCSSETSSRSPRTFSNDTKARHNQDAQATLGIESRSTPGRYRASSFAGPSPDYPAASASQARRPSFNPRLSLFPSVMYIPPPDVPRRQHFPPPDSLTDPIPHTWTKVTSDIGFVQQLLARFFASSLPCLSLVSQRHFMQDFREGNPRYCSEALVNAVLGMACKVTTETSQLVSRFSYGDAFLGEAKRLLAQENGRGDLPYTQTLGVLALAEISQGNEEEANDLARESVRISVRFLLQTQQRDQIHDDDFRTVRALAYCGSFSLVR
jgi:hypothetical protein